MLLQGLSSVCSPKIRNLMVRENMTEETSMCSLKNNLMSIFLIRVEILQGQELCLFLLPIHHPSTTFGIQVVLNKHLLTTHSWCTHGLVKYHHGQRFLG